MPTCRGTRGWVVKVLDSAVDLPFVAPQPEVDGTKLPPRLQFVKPPLGDVLCGIVVPGATHPAWTYELAFF